MPDTRAKKKTDSDSTYSSIQVLKGKPYPLGATLQRGGVNFALFSSHATDVNLVLFRNSEHEPVIELPLDPRIHKIGNIWHIFVRNLEAGTRYGYRLRGAKDDDPNIHRFDPAIVVTDPYARAFTGGRRWGEIYRRNNSPANQSQNIRRSLVVDDDFEWGFDRPLNIPMSDSIIYEVHVRGFTRDDSSGVDYPGTFRGLVEKIPYLKELGVTAVELLPINEFEEIENAVIHPATGEYLLNYWGYNPIGFFAPKASYAHASRDGEQIREFKKMVKALHDAGIEVILDMVFNHTAEGNENGPVYNFKGLDNSIYYIIDPKTGRYHNYSGCGNTLNCNHPVVRDLILDCLRYWVTEMHIDGFRFDLASILGRGQDGSVLSNPPLLERIAKDPILANTKLIAEAWDAAGLYQVGSFPSWGRWAEWNGMFRDDVRRFVKGDEGMVNALATRLSGSSDLYQLSGRSPVHSVNFITAHDGFTLMDLVSYNNKHNLENGEENRDGHNHENSWNCGVEGETDNPEINALRRRQVRNYLTILMMSHGVPMLSGGDEFGKTQGGNNNAYCQDNEISWFNWELLQTNQDLFRFVRELIRFRKAHPNLRRTSFHEDGGEAPIRITWHGTTLYQADWSGESQALGMLLHNNPNDNDIYLMTNAFWESQLFELPKLPKGKSWHQFLDTSLEAPADVTNAGEEVRLDNQMDYEVSGRTTVVVVAK